jgi:hypothetical protein
VTPAEAVEAAELAEAEIRYRNQLAREMYEHGRAAGWREGYAAAEADDAAEWARVTQPAVHGISHAELEERRWGPDGRARFGDPRPGDFPGRAARREPEPEPEAGL